MPKLKNTKDEYGWISISLHWLVAISVIGLFILGLWMRSLSYYDPWYRLGPDIHKSIGIILFAVLVFRVLVRLFNPPPAPLPSLSKFERVAAHGVHLLLYLLLFCIMISGYLISTADGRSIEVFNWFSIPALVTGIEHQEDLAGEIHYYLALSVIILAVIHALAAFKHHIIDKDNTLKRILGLSKPSQ
ncbi:cytochrome b [Zooshikella sp. RANM57]|uniref:cytochrome b n=1 Tax=Zooshikella sp. RANM57 TaxID=3425863 RepID=UPI003D6DEA2C